MSRPGLLNRWALALGASCALLCCACGGGQGGAPRPDVLLVTFDTLRADHTTVYGHDRPTTPALAALAAEGTTFEVAYAPTGATCPSHATLFTSRLPIEHGVQRNGLGLADGERTLAEYLAGHGWVTAAFVSSFPVSRRFGFGQGFGHYEDEFRMAGSKLDLERWGGEDLEAGFDRPGESTAAAASEWLEGAAGERRPLFVWVHFFDPHAPYAPRRRDARRFPPRPGLARAELRAAYEAEIRRADDALGTVLEAFERCRPGRGRVALLTADHGESLGEHDYVGHNRTMYEPELRIPLVLHAPGRVPAGVRSGLAAHLVDVLPTLAAALDLEPDPLWHGRDLLAAGAGREERALFFQRPYYPRGRDLYDEQGPARGLRAGQWKYMEAPEEGRFELFDLSADPGEAENLYGAQPQRARALAEQLAAWVAAQEEAARAPVAEREEDLEGLRALGYLGDH